MKAQSLFVLFLFGLFCSNLLSQVGTYCSITNWSMHATNYQPNKLMLRVWPDVSTNTTNFYYPNNKPFEKTVFSISIINKTMMVGSTNNLRCRLDNQSENKVYYWTLTYVFLSNNASLNYQLLPDLEPSRAKNGIGFPAIGKGMASEWDLPFVIDKRVQPGDYELHASQGVVTSDAKFSWEIEANTLQINVVK